MHLIQAKFLLLWTSVALLSTICISKRSQRAALFRLWGFTTIWCSWASLSETLSAPSAGRSVFSVTLTLSLSHHHFPCWLHTLDQMTFFFSWGRSKENIDLTVTTDCCQVFLTWQCSWEASGVALFPLLWLRYLWQRNTFSHQPHC